MSLLKEAKFLIEKHRVFPKKRLGQHFTIDSSVFQQIVESGSITSSDTVLEIGAGLGFLTRFLAERCRKVLAVETDSRLASLLRIFLKDLQNVDVIEGDVLKVQLPQFNKIASIPPYGISSPLIQWLYNKNFDCAILVLQKEFANKLAATVGSSNYGWLTILTYYHFEVELLSDVPKRLFYPPPKVDSTIVRLRPRFPPPFKINNLEKFKRLVQSLFTQRNRKIKNAVEAFIKREHICTEETAKKLGFIPFQERRIRELAPEDFGVLANGIAC
ncbi:MAG: 16S rRNA (adenine(1518)-N(6)/adenine(1519)-N(6))-dimethyltransferase RsmA [Candidatus Bathyarchaeia archaeon]